MLRILKKLHECREDNVFDYLQADLQEVLNFECVCSATYGRFVERYVGMKASLHIHNVICFRGRSIDL